MEIESQCLLLEEYSKQSFSLMDSFWVEIDVKSFNINWLVKVRGYLDKVEKEEQKLSRKCCLLYCSIR